MERKRTNQFTLNEQEIKNAVIAYFEILYERIGHSNVELNSSWNDENRCLDYSAQISIVRTEVINEPE